MRPVPHVDAAALAGMIDPAHTALIVVDVQEDFAAPHGAVARAGADMSGVAPALARIEALLAAAREAGVTVAFTRVMTSPRTDSAALKLLHARGGEAADSLALCRAGERGSAYHHLAPAADDIEVEKRLYDAFHETDLEAQLRARGVETLVLVGFSTHCCVDATARAAFHRDFNVFIISDASDSYDPDAHWATLRALRSSCALIAVASAAIAAWRG